MVGFEQRPGLGGSLRSRGRILKRQRAAEVEIKKHNDEIKPLKSLHMLESAAELFPVRAKPPDRGNPRPSGCDTSPLTWGGAPTQHVQVVPGDEVMDLSVAVRGRDVVQVRLLSRGQRRVLGVRGQRSASGHSDASKGTEGRSRTRVPCYLEGGGRTDGPGEGGGGGGAAGRRSVVCGCGNTDGSQTTSSGCSSPTPQLLILRV